ncbi:MULTISPECIES: hypothetical protein [unclassified Lacrimispora]|uniref:hypothetical protein n=1 Tax=unclassified Lacrimispora TaxID=2719232 RepID=UPI00376F8540
MGTSKGYIPPTDQKWKNAKRAVGNIGKKGYSHSSIQGALKKYADAYSSTHLRNSNVTNVIGGLLGFITDIQKSGFEVTLQQYGLSHFKDLKGLDLYKGLLDYFAKDVNTPDGQIIRDGLGDTFDKLGINEFDDLAKLDVTEFLLTFLTEFIVKGFEECFAEKIIEKMDDLNKYDDIIREAEKIVEDRVFVDQSIKDILSIDLKSAEGKDYTTKIINNTYESLKAMEVIANEDMDK